MAGMHRELEASKHDAMSVRGIEILANHSKREEQT